MTALPRRPLRRPLVLAGLLGCALAALSGCAAPRLPPVSLPSVPLPSRASFYGGPHPTGDFAPIPYASWTDDEPDYRLYLGDSLTVAFPSAPELNRDVTVQPDGRISLPLIPQVMAADRSVPELQATLAQAYAGQLRQPLVEVTVKTASPIQIFVAGQVKNPGVYTMPGDINALQGVVLAGDFLTGARRNEVVIIRRGPDGRAMMRVVDLRKAIYSAGGVDAVPLRRFDIVYVPKTTLQAIGDVVTEIRNALPIQFQYVIGGSYTTN